MSARSTEQGAHRVTGETAERRGPPPAGLLGAHAVEPDFGAHGLWVSRRLEVCLPPNPEGSDLRLTGYYFPKLIAALHGRGDSTLSVQIGGRPVSVESLAAHGRFELRIGPTLLPREATVLSVTCDRCFVPAQIGEGNDQRELSWRLTGLWLGSVAVFSAQRQFNFFLSAESIELVPSTVPNIRAHVDSPRVASDSSFADAFGVSGWAVDLEAISAAPVRVWVGRKLHDTRRTDRPDVREAFDSPRSLPLATGFEAVVTSPVGVSEFRIEVLTSTGHWAVVTRGLVVRAPSRTTDAKRWAERVAVVLPKAARSRLLDRWRALRTPPSRELLPASYRVHLDTPPVGRVHVAGAELLVSGWAFDEAVPASVPVRVRVGDKTLSTNPRQRGDVQKAFPYVESMPVDCGFARVLKLPLGLHRVAVQIQRPDLGWVTVRQALVLRAPDRLQGNSPTAELTFRAYRKLQKEEDDVQLSEIRRHVRVMVLRPHFHVVVRSSDSQEGALAQTVSSLQRQTYPDVTVSVLSSKDDAGDADIAANWNADSEFVVLLRAGQTLDSLALYVMASEINRDPTLDLVYADETTVAAEGTDPSPFYKPDWSPDYIETFNYIGGVAAYRASGMRACWIASDSRDVYDLLLRFTERNVRVRHVARILGHDGTRTDAGRPRGEPDMRARTERALSDRLLRTGRRGRVLQHEQHMGCFRLSIELTTTPLVSVVIPTAGKTISLKDRSIDLIVNIVHQIARASSYHNIEFIVVDNGDLSQQQMSALQRHGCRLTTYTEPVFNISKKLNQGVRHAKGELLLLMNDDIEVLEPDWIGRMVAHFEKPHVGVVGAKLLYPDSKTQHVGVAHNSGNPDHVRRMYPRDDAGYFFSTCGVRNFSAVTGACMMTPADVYRAVGGYSEELAVSYNDTDYCMKVRALGRTVVYSPDVELTHMESQSRVASADMREVAWYQRRWAAEVVEDPFYNERFLAVAPPTFELKVNERLL